MTVSDTGTLEKRKDAGEGSKGVVKLWLNAIDLASKEEEKWRGEAEKAIKIYRDDNESGQVNETEHYNILYSNIETIIPALYNSTPIPDIRRRFGEADEAGKLVAQALERVLSYSIDTYDFDAVMTAAVQDSELAGRGVTRVRYEPVFGQEAITDEMGQPKLDEMGNPVMPVVYEEVKCEHVPWANFRRGPGRNWDEVPWIAFELFLKREELEKLNPKVGRTIKLDITIEGGDDKNDTGSPPPDTFKRARVWEVWDKEKREVLFIAPSYTDAPLKREKDQYELVNFYPIPKPMYSVQTTDTLVPIDPYRYYRSQAEELDKITRRITALIAILKWRGFRSSDIDELDRMSNAEDGDLLPIINPAAFAGKNGLESAIYLMPIDKVITVLQSLYQQRNQIKQIIQEITGISDILRGSTNPNETFGAQQLKAQWGSQRLQRHQNAVAAYARDILRIKAELIATKFSPETITMMTGVQLTPEAIELMRSDLQRQYRIDIETNSTIRADLTRAQENISTFLTGFSQFITSVGPAVQSGDMPKDVATDLLSAFARNFKLGRQAEDALERMGQGAQQGQADQQQMMQQQAMMQQQQAEQEAQSKAQAEQQKQAADMTKQQMEQEKAMLDLELKRQEHAMKMQEMTLQHQIKMTELQAQAKAVVVESIKPNAAGIV